MPPADGELSVAHVDGLSEPKIWLLGRRILAGGEVEAKIYGRGDILASDVTAARLRVLRDDDPFRHAKIVDWPPISEDDKSLRLEIAQELARLSKFRPNPS